MAHKRVFGNDEVGLKGLAASFTLAGICGGLVVLFFMLIAAIVGSKIGEAEIHYVIKDFGSLSFVFATGVQSGRLPKSILRLHNCVLQKVNGCLFNGADLQQDIP